jgi:5-methylcytosine-specific restriction endonuclease McrA
MDQLDQLECANPRCHNLFTPKSAQHGFCCEKCRRQARGSQWRKFRNAALRRDQWTCQDCTAHDCRLEVHHLHPLCKGGTHKLANLLTLCVKCHRARHRSWKSWKQAISWELEDVYAARRPEAHESLVGVA